MNKYKCPFCGREYNNADEVMNCASSCRAKLTQKENENKIILLKEKVKKLSEEITKCENIIKKASEVQIKYRERIENLKVEKLQANAEILGLTAGAKTTSTNKKEEHNCGEKCSCKNNKAVKDVKKETKKIDYDYPEFTNFIESSVDKLITDFYSAWGWR